MSNFLEKIIYLTENQYQQLVQNNQVNNNYLYITNEDGVTLNDLGLTVVDVIHGGTGCNNFPVGEVLVGNGMNPVTTVALKALAYKDSLTTSDIPDLGGTYIKKVTSTDNAIVRFNGTDGTVQNSKVIIDDNGNILVSHVTSNDVAATSANPKITFAESGTQPVHLIYSDYDSYRSPAGLKVVGGASATPAWFEAEGSIFANGGYRVPHTGNTTGTVGGITVPVYIESGIIKAGTALGESAYHPDSYFKTTQTAITDNTASTSATTTFVQAVTQNANGEITVTKAPLDTSGTWSGNAATATEIETAGNTAQFYRGDNTWSNIIKQTASAALGIDSNLKIGQARKDLNFDISNGSGTGINNGNAGGITWGSGDTAYAGIYYQSSGSYGSRLLFGTTSSYANGAYARMIIQNNGNVGIGTLTPDKLLTVNGTAYIHGATTINGAATFNSTVSISGATTLSSTLTVSDATTINNTLTVSGATTINNTANVTGAATFDDDVTIAGTATIGDIIVGSGTSQNTIATSGNNLDMILSPTGKLCLYQGGSSGTAKVILNGNTFYPYTDNQVSLGIDGNAWKELYAKTIITTPAGSSTKPIYIAATGAITESNATVGSQYQPVYLSSGTITAAYPVQYLSWTFANANDNQIVFSNQLFTASTYVLSIVVTGGESNLNGPITWTSGAGTLTLSTSPVTGVVSGYMLISFGADLSSTISGTSSHSNT